MRTRLPKILISGGAGFIGSAFVRLLAKRDCPRRNYAKVIKRGLSLNKIIVVDKLTYAGNLARLKECKGKYKFYKADICHEAQIETIFKKEKPEILINFAAETHVDRSILDSKPFLKTNIIGIRVLLDISRRYKIKKFLHISTDEVYGEIPKGKFKENSPLKPNSPYAASKAAADLLVNAYVRTYSFPAIIIRPSNNYGPWQYPEKLIPLTILKILRNEKIPVYSEGKNVREWLYVDDCVEGIFQILKKGKIGEIYNLGSNEEKENIGVVKEILKILKANKNLIQFVKDRPGHDIRYSLNSKKVRRQTGWLPKTKFEDGLKKTAEWCVAHRLWLLNKYRCIAPLYK